MKNLMLILPVFMLTACMGIARLDTYQQAQIEAQLPPIDPEGGQLCMFRVSSFIGMAATFNMQANSEDIGRLSNSSYFCANLLPGEYIITGEASYGRVRVAGVGTETTIRQGQRKYIELKTDVTTSAGQLIHQTREIGLGAIYNIMKRSEQ